MASWSTKRAIPVVTIVPRSAPFLCCGFISGEWGTSSGVPKTGSPNPAVIDFDRCVGPPVAAKTLPTDRSRAWGVQPRPSQAKCTQTRRVSFGQDIPDTPWNFHIPTFRFILLSLYINLYTHTWNPSPNQKEIDVSPNNHVLCKGFQLPYWNNHLFLVVWGSRY